MAERKIPPYPIGPVEGAFLEVVKLNSRHATSLAKDRYVVYYPCCGYITEVTGKTIRDRQHRATAQCRLCRARNDGPRQVSAEEKLETYNIQVHPNWPIPNKKYIGQHIPFYDRAWNI